MRVLNYFSVLLFLFSLSTLSISTFPATSRAASGASAGRKMEVKGSRHRLTGTVVEVDARGGTVMVKGRRGELTFDVHPEKAQKIAPGERVRVYYVTTPDKKNVVIRVKKINNEGEGEGGKRGLKGPEEGGN